MLVLFIALMVLLHNGLGRLNRIIYPAATVVVSSRNHALHDEQLFLQFIFV